MRRLIWLPTCAKKHLVILELAIFYLSQGNIDNAYNATRTLIAKDGLQTEPTLNLIHGLISYDKWHSGLPKDMQLEEFDVYNESCTISMASNGCEEIDLQDSSDDNCSMDVDDASFPACSAESSINNGNIDKKRKIPKKPAFFHPVEESDSLGSQLNEEMDTDFRSVFFNTSNSPTCGYYNTIQLLETIALHLDSAIGKPCIWEELVSCFLRLFFSDWTTDYEDCISWSVQGDAAITAFSGFSSVFFERHTRESWKVRCRWWMNHHFSQNTYMSETLKGDCKLLASKAACAFHLFSPGFQYVKAVESYLSEQEAKDKIGFLSRNLQNSVRLLQTLEKLT